MTASTAITPQIAAKPKVETAHASTGEKLYNLLVYTGLNYFANLGISLIICDYFTHGAGKKNLDKIITSTEKTLANTQFFTTTGANKLSTGFWRTLALTSGGVIASLLTKPLEDNKRPIVHWLNKISGVDQTAADGHEMKPDEIYIEKEQPPQTWWNVIKRRFCASFVILTAGAALNHTVGLKNIENSVVGTVNNGLKSGYVPAGKALANNQTFQRYLGYAALDTIFAAIHAVTMKLTNGAKKAKMPHEIGGDSDPAGTAKPNEIIIQPDTQPSLHNENVIAVVPASTLKNPDEYRRKTILPMDSYADMVSASEPGHNMAV